MERRARGAAGTTAEGFWFHSSRLCLDFALTGGESEIQRRYERLHAPADLGRWLAACELGVEGARVTRADLAGARELREAVWEAAHAAIAGRPASRADAATINRIAARPALRRELGPAGEARWAPRQSASAALATIAADAVELFGGPDRDRVRECANPRCAIVFFDDSRPRRRRWCSMERCGNRAKAARHRSRPAD